MDSDLWSVFHIDELKRQVEGAEPKFREFLKSQSLTCAIYHLPIGSRDMQAPHLEDEIYFVVSGRATLKVGEQKHNVAPGSILYVRATDEHSFFNIEEALTLIAVFGLTPRFM